MWLKFFLSLSINRLTFCVCIIVFTILVKGIRANTVHFSKVGLKSAQKISAKVYIRRDKAIYQKKRYLLLKKQQHNFNVNYFFSFCSLCQLFFFLLISLEFNKTKNIKLLHVLEETATKGIAQLLKKASEITVHIILSTKLFVINY